MGKSKKTKSRSENADETQYLIDCYAALLASDKAMFRDESLLPASKYTLKRALWGRILEAESEEVRDAYKAAYLFLSSFLSGVGLKGIELSVANIKEWGELSEIMNTELNELEKELEFIEEKAIKREPSAPQTRGQAA
jgi:hypothetical protein